MQMKKKKQKVMDQERQGVESKKEKNSDIMQILWENY